MLASAYWEFPVGVLEFIFGSVWVLVFWAEHERWPLQRRHWQTQIRGDRFASQVVVNVVRKNETVRIATLDPSKDTFPNQLAEAESLARERCIQLDLTQRALKA